MGRFAASGTERQLAGMLEAVVRGGQWEPTLGVLRSGEPYARELERAGVPLLEFGAGSDADPRRLLALRQAVRDGGFDVLHSSLYGANAVTRLSLLGRRPPLVVSERRVEDWRSRPASALDRGLRFATDQWIGNSPDVADFIVRTHRAPRARVHVIRNGIDGEVFHPRPAGDRAPGPLRVGSVARLIRVKGFDVLIEAVRRLGHRDVDQRDADHRDADHLDVDHLDVEYLVVGEGPERAALEAQARGLPVRFVGELHEPAAVADFLRSLDVFVLPSRSEGLPNVVLEAAMCGLPVVSTTAPGLKDAAADAVLVAPDDVEALAGALRRQLRERVPARAVDLRTFTEVADGHAEVFTAAALRRARA